MTPNKNYFNINRKLLKSGLWLKEKFTKGQAWVDLIGLAQHTRGEFEIRGIKIVVERGQLAWAEETLAKRWKWSREKVRRYFFALVCDNKLRQQKNNIVTINIIVNYDKYQYSKLLNETPNETTDETPNETYTIKNKKEKKKKAPTKLDFSLTKAILEEYQEKFPQYYIEKERSKWEMWHNADGKPVKNYKLSFYNWLSNGYSAKTRPLTHMQKMADEMGCPFQQIVGTGNDKKYEGWVAPGGEDKIFKTEEEAMKWKG